jgi:hypothetical protein
MKFALLSLLTCLIIGAEAFAQEPQPPSSAAPETYVQASVIAGDQLRIVTKDGRVILPKRQPDQVSFDKVTISPDGHAVGWQAMFPNCCAWYPLPLQLVVYSNGTEHRFSGNQLPVWRWAFQTEGKQVAFEQETVHGELGVHYELREVATGQLAAEYNPDPKAAAGDAPRWVTELNAKK